MNSDQMKRQVAEAALAYVPHGCVLGVGTGSTVNHFIAALADRKVELAGAVSDRKSTRLNSSH